MIEQPGDAVDFLGDMFMGTRLLLDGFLLNLANRFQGQYNVPAGVDSPGTSPLPARRFAGGCILEQFQDGRIRWPSLRTWQRAGRQGR